MARNTVALVLSASLACLLVASHVFVRAAPAENELHYSGDNGDNKNINDYTDTITDNNRPSRTDNQRRPNGPFGGALDGLFGGFDNGRSPLGPRPSNNNGQFGLGEPLFQGPPRSDGDLFQVTPLFDFSLPRLPIFDNIIRSFTETRRDMDRKFEELRRQAVDGVEEMRFERNGVTYVKTCTIKRVTPENNANYGQQGQVQPNQMQPGQFQPNQVQPSDQGSGDKSTQDQIVSPVDVSDDSSSLDTPRGSQPSSQESQSNTDSSSPASQSQTQPGANTQSSDNNTKPTN